MKAWCCVLAGAQSEEVGSSAWSATGPYRARVGTALAAECNAQTDLPLSEA